MQVRASDPTPGRPWTLEDIGRVYGQAEVDRVVAHLRTFIAVPEPPDMDDSYLILLAWFQAHVQDAVDEVVRLVVACPALQQVDWYPNGSVASDGVVRWRFSFKEVRTLGSGELSGTVTNTLSWDGGSAIAAPPAFQVLVGDELVAHQRRYNFARDMYSREGH